MIHKKGDASLWSNYRPIAVVHLLSKLLAVLLERRLADWTEEEGLRRPAQMGFRRGQSTLSNGFVVQHFIDKCKHKRKKLFICAIDLAKAYDSVPRPKIWARMHELGIQGKFLFTVAALYKHTSLSIRHTTGILPPFPSTIGVKQGCPLSPLLFGLFIEQLDEKIVNTHAQLGPCFTTGTNAHVPDVLFADDTTLLSIKHDSLQQLMDTTCTWGDVNHMGLNNDKTEAIVIHSRKYARTWQVNGFTVHSIPDIRLLGIHFHENASALHGMRMAASKGRKAIGGLYRKLKELGVGKNIALILRLYRIMVEPVLLYGSEVWGVCLLTTQKHKARDAVADPLDLEEAQRTFLRGALKFKRNTPAWVMYRETGLYPVQYSVLSRILNFIVRSIDLDAREYLKMSLIDNFNDFKAKGVKNWFHSLFIFLEHIGFRVSHINSITYFTQGNVDRILCKWRKFYYDKIWEDLASDPRTAPSDNIKLCTYHNWFAPPLPAEGEKWQPAIYTTLPNIPYRQATALTKFRTSSHHLLIEELRGQTPRHTRICTLCNQGIQDEHHIIFECTALNELRHQHHNLAMNGANSLNTLFNRADNSGILASFVAQALQLADPAQND
jgi:hypothetical protein